MEVTPGRDLSSLWAKHIRANDYFCLPSTHCTCLTSWTMNQFSMEAFEHKAENPLQSSDRHVVCVCVY